MLYFAIMVTAKKKEKITGLLFDIEGVLKLGNRSIASAADTVRKLQQQGYAMACITNTSTQTRKDIHLQLQHLGFPFSIANIITPLSQAIQIVGNQRIHPIVHANLMPELASLHINTQSPDYIIMGDIGTSGYTPELLQTLFTQIMQGTQLIALHKNRFWQQPTGLQLDIGAYVAALEYASNTQAMVIGKPSPTCFEQACRRLQCRPAQTLMIGDDIDADIAGAGAIGMRTALVQTGKYRASFVQQHHTQPDMLLPSVAALPEVLEIM